MRAFFGASLVFFTLIGTASAGTITAVGAVKALNNVSQMQGVVGTGNFDEGPTTGQVPLNVYSAMGLTWQVGPLSTILPGVTNTGAAVQPEYETGAWFPLPIAGGGTHVGQSNHFAGVATFSSNITQVGLTASNNGQQWLTAWNKSGALIGQVSWTPASDSAFVGIDTMGVPMGMVSYGNHDIWGGQPYGVGGLTIFSDSWIWAAGSCSSNADCDDGNPCTTDTCTAATGTCSHTNNTAPCSPANLCLVNGVCQGGACTGGTAGPPCTALDGCHTPGVCNPMDGMCSNPVKVNGTACNDNNACTATDTCQGGVCTGMNPVMCAPPDSCHTGGMCDMASGMCTYTAQPDGTTCDDGNACTQGDTCMAGVCTGGTTVTCTAMDPCHDVGMCDTTTGMCSNPVKADGASCSNGDLCTHDTCMTGVCTAGTPVACTALDACHDAGMCDSTTGICSNPAAPDGTTCPGGTCASGTCVPPKAGTGGSAGAGGSSGTGGTTNPDQSGGCHCGVPGSSTGGPAGTPAAALLMILALRRRRRAARATLSARCLSSFCAGSARGDFSCAHSSERPSSSSP